MHMCGEDTFSYMWYTMPPHQQLVRIVHSTVFARQSIFGTSSLHAQNIYIVYLSLDLNADRLHVKCDSETNGSSDEASMNLLFESATR